MCLGEQNSLDINRQLMSNSCLLSLNDQVAALLDQFVSSSHERSDTEPQSALQSTV